jgi:hypothetical protein
MDEFAAKWDAKNETIQAVTGWPIGKKMSVREPLVAD